MLRTLTIPHGNPHGPPFTHIDHGTRLVAIFLRFAGAASSAAVGLVRTWFQRHRQRRALAGLDDRLLRDIGVIQAQARHEAAKPFWFGGKA